MLSETEHAELLLAVPVGRIDPDRLGAIRNGRVVVLLTLVGLTPMRKGLGVLRAELEGLAVVSNRAVEILPVEGAAATVLEGLDVLCHRLAHIVDDVAACRAPDVGLVGAGGALAPVGRRGGQHRRRKQLRKETVRLIRALP
jgi:hypothetical protein